MFGCGPELEVRVLAEEDVYALESGTYDIENNSLVDECGGLASVAPGEADLAATDTEVVIEEVVTLDRDGNELTGYRYEEIKAGPLDCVVGIESTTDGRVTADNTLEITTHVDVTKVSGFMCGFLPVSLPCSVDAENTATLQQSP